LAWLRDERVRPRLLELATPATLAQELDFHCNIAKALLWMGELDVLLQTAETALRISLTYPRNTSTEEGRGWHTVRHLLRERAPEALADIEARTATSPIEPAEYSKVRIRERVVPRRTMTYGARRPDPDQDPSQPPAKFWGLPDWRDEPAWPVGGDDRLLIFYGQLPLPGDRTAYIFLGGPDEFEPLGPGNAIVVQPGNHCHLPTRPCASGPQEYGGDPHAVDRIRPYRYRPVPAEPRYVTFTDERGDGAECYGWINDDGRAAFAWDCH
jgi:hypothetical protein